MALWTYACSTEIVDENRERVEMFPYTGNITTVSGIVAGDTNHLRLSSIGLWEGYGEYYSPVFDFGRLITLNEVEWTSVEGNSGIIDSIIGGAKTIEIRYNDIYPPILNNRGSSWQPNEYSHPEDLVWGLNGITWNVIENTIPFAPIDIRYVQWKAIFRSS